MNSLKYHVAECRIGIYFNYIFIHNFNLTKFMGIVVYKFDIFILRKYESSK